MGVTVVGWAALRVRSWQAGGLTSCPVSLGKLSLPQDLEEDAQLSDKGEEASGLSRRNPAKASFWPQVGTHPDLQHAHRMTPVPGDTCPSPGP